MRAGRVDCQFGRSGPPASLSSGVKRLDMPRIPPLPDSLEYLKPVRKQLAALRVEELNEDLDPSMVEVALAGRIAGLPPSLARERLRADARLSLIHI